MTCKYLTKNGRCGLKGSYAYKHACYTPDFCKCWEPPTNADRIRAMSDEKIAEDAYIIRQVHGRDRFVSLFTGKPFDTKEEVIQHNLDWLAQPAQEE